MAKPFLNPASRRILPGVALILLCLCAGAVIVPIGLMITNAGIPSPAGGMLESVQPPSARIVSSVPTKARPSTRTATVLRTRFIPSLTETATAAPFGTPTPLPDGGGGGHIVFESDRDMYPHIFIMEIDGSQLRQLTSGPNWYMDPSWSPHGGKIVFMSTRGGSISIHVMNSDGSNSRALTESPANDFEPAWSPDGKWIAFTSTRADPRLSACVRWCNDEIYIMNTNGFSIKRLTFSPTSDRNPSWSPDGKKIAFMSDRDGNAEIYIMNFDGSNSVRLTDNTANDREPAWSPDGKRIAFESNRGGKFDIYVMDSDGSNVVQLTRLEGDATNPAWSPDGTRILFESIRDPSKSKYCLNPCTKEICVMDADGTNVVRLTHTDVADSSPAWQP